VRFHRSRHGGEEKKTDTSRSVGKILGQFAKRFKSGQKRVVSKKPRMQQRMAGRKGKQFKREPLTGLGGGGYPNPRVGKLSAYGARPDTGPAPRCFSKRIGTIESGGKWGQEKGEESREERALKRVAARAAKKRPACQNHGLVRAQKRSLGREGKEGKLRGVRKGRIGGHQTISIIG